MYPAARVVTTVAYSANEFSVIQLLEWSDVRNEQRHYFREQSGNGPSQNHRHQRLARTQIEERCTNILRVLQFLLTIYQGLQQNC